MKAHAFVLELSDAQFSVFEAALKWHGATRPPKGMGQGKGLGNKEAALVAFVTEAQAAGA